MHQRCPHGVCCLRYPNMDCDSTPRSAKRSLTPEAGMARILEYSSFEKYLRIARTYAHTRTQRKYINNIGHLSAMGSASPTSCTHQHVNQADVFFFGIAVVGISTPAHLPLCQRVQPAQSRSLALLVDGDGTATAVREAIERATESDGEGIERVAETENERSKERTSERGREGECTQRPHAIPDLCSWVCVPSFKTRDIRVLLLQPGGKWGGDRRVGCCRRRPLLLLQPHRNHLQILFLLSIL